jgi:hypothetical protein
MVHFWSFVSHIRSILSVVLHPLLPPLSTLPSDCMQAHISRWHCSFLPIKLKMILTQSYCVSLHSVSNSFLILLLRLSNAKNDSMKNSIEVAFFITVRLLPCLLLIFLFRSFLLIEILILTLRIRVRRANILIILFIFRSYTWRIIHCASSAW